MPLLLELLVVLGRSRELHLFHPACLELVI
jgi:hypothetical protein